MYYIVNFEKKKYIILNNRGNEKNRVLLIYWCIKFHFSSASRSLVFISCFLSSLSLIFFCAFSLILRSPE